MARELLAIPQFSAYLIKQKTFLIKLKSCLHRKMAPVAKRCWSTDTSEEFFNFRWNAKTLFVKTCFVSPAVMLLLVRLEQCVSV